MNSLSLFYKQDPFNELASFKKFVGWYRLIQTPPDATMGNCSLTPALSDGNWESVWEVSMGWSAGAFIATDPTYANALFGAWENACAPMGLEPSPPAMLSSFLFIGCVRESDGCGERYSVPFATSSSSSSSSSSSDAWLRRSALLTGYAVLEDPTSSSNPYLILTTSTQRQTEGHEHPDRGSFSLYHGGTPLVLDPGVGWCGYNWFGMIPSARSNGTAFDKNLTFGAWCNNPGRMKHAASSCSCCCFSLSSLCSSFSCSRVTSSTHHRCRSSSSTPFQFWWIS